MNYNKAEANYNMDFNNGHFKQGKVYKYRYDKDKEKVLIITEEGIEQDFSILQFVTNFFVL